MNSDFGSPSSKSMSTRPKTPPNSLPTPHLAPSPSPSPLAKSSKQEEASNSQISSASTMPADIAEATTSAPALQSTNDIASAPPLLIKKLAPSAQTPTRGSAFAAGYDLYSAKETMIPARGKGLVDTQLAIAVPAGTCELIVVSSLYQRSRNELMAAQMVELHREAGLLPKTSSIQEQA